MGADLGSAIAQTLRELRQARALSGTDLAARAGISRAMLSRVEHGHVQPTAVLLARLAAALDVSLSELVARAEHTGRRLARAAEQPMWTDPETGYHRRAVSPAPGGPLELAEVELPPGAEVSYPAEAYNPRHQQVWVLEGTLTLREGTEEHTLARGDCLAYGPPAARLFANRTAVPCRYLVATARLGA
jgi:transcriptional regulator with XRE-family HTH domain